MDDESESGSDTSRQRPAKCLDHVLINLCGMAWATDNNLLPAVFFFLEQRFKVGPKELSILTMVRGITESLFAFPSGFLAELFSRPQLVCIGCLIWAFGLAVCGISETWWGVVAGRFVNGIGLGIVQPLLASLIADLNPPDRRGRAFGVFQFTGNMASTGGTALATVLGAQTIMGMAGWRFTFLVIASLSALSGILLYLFVSDPNVKVAGIKSKNLVSVLQDNIPRVRAIFCIPSFLMIIGQGAAGIVPWYAFSFLTMWMQLSCFSREQAAGIYFWFGIGSALCGLFGGAVHDVVVRRFPDHGQPLMCIFMASIGIPLLSLILFGLGDGVDADAGTVAKFSITFFVFGTLISGNSIVNNSMFAAIVPQAVYSYVYASDRAVEGTIGALCTPAVGWLTEQVFFYNKTAAESGVCDLESGKGLGSGVFAVSAAAWTICILFYIRLTFTYPVDRRRMQSGELESSASAKLGGSSSSSNEESE